MSSPIAKPAMQSAAWRISFWATLAFAAGTMLVFTFLHSFIAHDINRRSDAWLSGEVEVLGDVAERTPQDALYGRVIKEVAELASKEVPNKQRSNNTPNDSVFFLQTNSDGSPRLWVGAGSGEQNLRAIRGSRIRPDTPSDLHVKGFGTAFRVASIRTTNGSLIYLGLSERDESRVLNSLRLRFLALWLLIVLLGFAIVFYSTRRMLGHIRDITQAASKIGQSDLSSRVPTTQRNDEVAHLALTLNRMLDRIESSIHQLHTITDSLAHDLRSPLTAIRGKLEMSLGAGTRSEQTDPIVSAVDELDRVTEFLNKSLDVSEAKANALRLNRSCINLDDLLRAMIDLYEPCMAEKEIRIQLSSAGPVSIWADAALIHRMIANLFDNEFKHLPASSSVTFRLLSRPDGVVLTLEDDGPGFASEVGIKMFDRRVKGSHSSGNGLGLAFVEAVAHAHGGTVTASNRREGGAQLIIWLAAAAEISSEAAPSSLLATGNAR